LAGCSTAVSDASPTTLVAPTTSSTSTSTTSTTAPPTTLPPETPSTEAAPAGLLWTLGQTWAHTSPSSCLVVMDGERVLFERNPDAPVLPASTMKLLTATAVLTRIDPGTRLRTTAVAPVGPDATGTLRGDLFLFGGGDQLLGTLPYGAHFAQQPHLLTALEVLADRVRDAGVHHVTGRIVGDDSRYDRTRYLPSWPAGYVADHEAGPLSALLVNDGAATWGPRDKAFADPAAGAAGVFAGLLRQRGVVVDGGTASGDAPPAAHEVAAMDSPTIAELVQEMLLDSNNNTAELLLRELGLRVLAQPTTEAGTRVVLDTLTRMGMPMGGVQMVDGSGLDHGDRVTCRLLTAILTTSPVRLLVARGLPVAGQSGTLWKRFLRTPVAGHLRAKTGTLRTVEGLAGYADSMLGRSLTFAYVQNGVGTGQGNHLQDELGRDLVTAG